MAERWEYPGDRRELKRWLAAPGPCKRPYWHLADFDRVLTICVERDEQRLAVDLPMWSLETNDWRGLVAYNVKRIRGMLKSKTGEYKWHNVE